MPSRTLKLRRAGRCVGCAVELPVSAEAWWDSATRTVTCLSCLAAARQRASVAPLQTYPDLGHAGASLDREWERRKTGRERRTREAHPHIGSLLLALQDAPQHESAFWSGATGERKVAKSLSERIDPSRVTLFHNRRMPGGKGDIDHIAVAPTGVYVIDAKALHGKLTIESPWFGQPTLRIAGRDRTKLIDGLDRQVAAVHAALAHGAVADVQVHGVLCFTDADLPLWRTQTFRGHLLAYPKAIAKRLNAAGPLDTAGRDALVIRLATYFPSA